MFTQPQPLKLLVEGRWGTVKDRWERWLTGTQALSECLRKAGLYGNGVLTVGHSLAPDSTRFAVAKANQKQFHKFPLWQLPPDLQKKAELCPLSLFFPTLYLSHKIIHTQTVVPGLSIILVLTKYQSNARIALGALCFKRTLVFELHIHCQWWSSAGYFVGAVVPWKMQSYLGVLVL